MHEALWAGVELKMDHAAFFRERMQRVLEPPERTQSNVALQASGAVIGTGWQRSLYAYLDAFLVMARSVPEVIEARSLSKAYDTPLFQDLNLQVERGQCVGVMGPNGSGKTTLIKTLIGRVKPGIASGEAAARLDALAQEADWRPRNKFSGRTEDIRLAMLPVTAALAFEVIRLAGKYRDVKWLQGIVAPGLMTQRLTTREPDPSMIEVAVRSLQSVMEREAFPAAVVPNPEPAVVS